MLLTKEWYDLVAQFEKQFAYMRLDKEKDKELWKKGHVYEDGHTNLFFMAFSKGYAFGKVVGRE